LTLLWLALPTALLTGRTDTVGVQVVRQAPELERLADTSQWGAAPIRLRTGQGTASVWLLRAGDSVYLVATIPDTTRYWGDDLVLSLDTEGDAADAPQHDDFQWYLRRTVDSSVVYRGRAGRWDPPQGDPDWRLGRAREGAGWSVEAAELDGHVGWIVILRLDRGWIELPGKGAGLAIRIFDDSPSGWFAWPHPPSGMQPARVEQQPLLWAVVRSIEQGGSSGGAPRDGPGTRPS
jgi:hypothetical protein